MTKIAYVVIDKSNGVEIKFITTKKRIADAVITAFKYLPLEIVEYEIVT